MSGVARKWPVPSLDSADGGSPPNPDAVFSDLRGLMVAAPHDSDLILGAIARAAQSVTHSSGAAIAMRRGGVVICLGRSGETAPALGTRLGVHSGISGECLRIGQALRCDDTSMDHRADPEVCRQLGLRSIAAVPLREQGETVGVLEAFSTQPRAFAEEHMDSLMRLAELAEAAGTESVPEDDVPRLNPQTELADSAMLRLRHAKAPNPDRGLRLESRQLYRVAAVALGVLSLLAVVGWRARYNSADRVASSQQLATARNMEPIANTARSIVGSEPALFSKPSPNRVSTPSNKVLAIRIEQPVVGTTAADSVSRYRTAPDVRDRGLTPVALSAMDVPPAPKIAASVAGPNELGGVLSVPATLPQLVGPVSQGFSGGTIIHKVQPLYPPQARLLRLDGTVVLQATIAEDGTVHDLKVMSGNPLLARAAIEAVGHWRYRPFLLNRKPIRKEADISIDFKLPQ